VRVKRRGWYDIVFEILETAIDGKIKTHLMFKARLSQAQLNQYLPLLIERGLIERYTERKKKLTTRGYRTTKKGLKFLENLETMKELLEVAVDFEDTGKATEKPNLPLLSTIRND